MSAFIEVTRADGTPVSLNVDNIVDVWEPSRATGYMERYKDIHCCITTSASRDDDDHWPVREHYPAVMALIARAGAKVVR